MHARLEIYCEASRANGIVQAIMGAAHTGSAGDGIVALIPVEKLYRIRSKTEAKYEEA
jgi:nitrogen regulatory protein P-II 1